jgi:hypothetical protein
MPDSRLLRALIILACLAIGLVVGRMTGHSSFGLVAGLLAGVIVAGRLVPRRRRG